MALELSRLSPDLDFRFTVTLPPEWPEVQAIMEQAQSLGVSERIRNLGKVPVSSTPSLYENSHLVFLPSLLEVFSAVYPESLCTGVPLVTTDLRFARDICRDAACYYEPADAAAAARALLGLATDPQEWERLSQRGREVYAELPDAAGKWELQKDMIQTAAGRGR